MAPPSPALQQAYRHVKDAGTAYGILGLTRSSAHDPQEVKAAYRKIALLLHPDKCEDPSRLALHTSLFVRLQAAYEELSDGIIEPPEWRNEPTANPSRKTRRQQRRQDAADVPPSKPHEPEQMKPSYKPAPFHFEPEQGALTFGKVSDKKLSPYTLARMKYGEDSQARKRAQRILEKKAGREAWKERKECEAERGTRSACGYFASMRLYD